MRLLIWVLLAVTLAACSKKDKSGESPAAAADPAAFLKEKGSFCIVEKSGKAVAANLEQYEEVFVFRRDNSLSIFTFDLDSRRRIQFDGNGQPKMKEIEKAKFRVSGEKLVIKVDGAAREREAVFKRVTRAQLSCFELQPGKNSTVHCPCNLPEKTP